MGGQPRFFYGWVVLAVAFFSILVASVVWNSFQLFLVAFLQEFKGSSRAELSLIFSVSVIFYGFPSPIIGKLVERFGPRLVVPIGAVIMAAGLLASAAATELWHLYVFYGVLMAIGMGLVDVVPAYATLANWFVKRRGMALGIAGTGAGASIFIFVPIIQQLVLNLGWRTTYVVMAVFVLATVPALNLLFQRHRPQDVGQLPDGVQANSPAAVARDRLSRGDWALREALHTRAFWLLTIGIALIPFASQSLMVHQVAYIIDQGFDPVTAASVAVPLGFAGIVGRTTLTTLSDRLGRLPCYATSVTCLTLSVFALVALSWVHSVWLVYAYGFLLGLGYAAEMPLISAVVADVFQGRSFAVIFGCARVGGGVGGALGSWWAGFIFDQTGAYHVAFVGAILSAVLSFVCVALVTARPAPVPSVSTAMLHHH